MNQKMNSLEAVRALAFIGVFISHAGITGLSEFGAWGVSVFIILSGFLMYYSYGENDRIRGHGVRSSFRFGVNKIRKLYVLHVVTFLIAFPLYFFSNESHSFKSLWNTFAKIAVNLLLVQSWVPVRDYYFSFNGVSWYLSTILFLYIMFPFILSRMRRYRGRKDAIAILAGVAVLQIVLDCMSGIAYMEGMQIPNFVRWFTYVFPISRLWDFIIGCNLGYIFMHRNKQKELGTAGATILETLVWLVLLTEWAVYVHYVELPHNLNCWWGHAVLFALTDAVLVYLYALNKGGLSRLLTNRVTRFVAEISATAFMIHQLIFRYLEQLEKMMAGRVYRFGNLFLCMALTIVFSIVWERLKEKMNRKRGAKSL